MPSSRKALEHQEDSTLASYAQKSSQSRGRKFREAAPLWRTEFQRDRDRVIHSRAFRRLEYKTQVFLNGTGDHLRTRLTHTMEVAAIARNIARALRLNEDLAETISLAHDLGHPPFGHSGESALNVLMKEQGGFEHNRQSLRIVEELEQKYPAFPGLNLSWEVREGLVKHFTGYDRPAGRAEFTSKSPSLEAQVANVADEIAYYSHDLDDGLEAGLLQEQSLARGSAIWAAAAKSVKRQCGAMPEETQRSFTIRCLIDQQVKDVVRTSEKRIRTAKVRTADEVRRHPESLIGYSSSRRDSNLELRAFLYRNLYLNPKVQRPNRRAVKMLEGLFHYFVEHPNRIGNRSRQRASATGWPRAICDYLAGMTDRYAIQEHHRILRRSSPK